MAERHDELNEVRALLPWYVNGTLDGARAAQVRALIAASRELAAEVAWLERLREIERETVGDPPVGRAGLDALLERIAAEQGAAGGNVVTLQRPAKPAPRWWRPALALAATLLVVQGFAVVALLQRDHGGLQPLGGPAAPAIGATLQVTFRPDAREADIRAALTGVGARIVDGPGALGVYTIRVPAGEAARAREALAGAAAVERVSTP